MNGLRGSTRRARLEAPDRDQETEQDRLRARRAAGDVDVDGQNPVHAAGTRRGLTFVFGTFVFASLIGMAHRIMKPGPVLLSLAACMGLAFGSALAYRGRLGQRCIL